jgi:beta-lactamase regulating signal transducer with metallopeptidase domain
MIDSLGELALRWSHHALALFCQSAAVFAAVWVVAGLARKQSAPFRYLLWLVVLARLALPADLGLPVGIGSLGRPLFAHFAQPPALETAPVAAGVIAPRVEGGLASLLPGLALAAFLIWLSGVCLLARLMLGRFRALQGRISSAQPVTEGPLHALFLKCCQAIPPPKLPRTTLWISSGFASPLVIGLGRPRVILPQALLPVCTQAELESLLLHELAHVRRRDLLVNWIQVALQVLYWYNPLVWLANRQLRRERELCCDDQVLVTTPLTRRDYGAGLVRVLQMAPQREAWSLGIIGLLESQHVLQTRIERIMSRKRKITVRLTALSLASFLLFGGIVLAVSGPGKVADRKTTPPRRPASPAPVRALEPAPDSPRAVAPLGQDAVPAAAAPAAAPIPPRAARAPTSPDAPPAIAAGTSVSPAPVAGMRLPEPPPSNAKADGTGNWAAATSDDPQVREAARAQWEAGMAAGAPAAAPSPRAPGVPGAVAIGVPVAVAGMMAPPKTPAAASPRSAMGVPGLTAGAPGVPRGPLPAVAGMRALALSPAPAAPPVGSAAPAAMLPMAPAISADELAGQDKPEDK